MVYDYIIKLPITPAFSANIEAMFKLIMDDGGHSPTVVSKKDANGGHTDYSYRSQHGSVSSSGAQLLHFRLRERKTEAELSTYLESVMSNPKPPITVILIKSRDRVLNDGQDFEELLSIDKAGILDFFDIHTYDANGNITSTRKAELTDNISFSRYDGVPTITI